MVGGFTFHRMNISYAISNKGGMHMEKSTWKESTLLIVIGTVIGIVADVVTITVAIISAVKWIIKKATATDQG